MSAYVHVSLRGDFVAIHMQCHKLNLAVPNKFGYVFGLHYKA